jgi:hypothetical protein
LKELLFMFFFSPRDSLSHVSLGFLAFEMGLNSKFHYACESDYRK